MSASRVNRKEGPERLVMSAVGPAVGDGGASPSQGQSESKMPFGQACYLVEEAGISGSRRAELGLVLDVTGRFSALELYIRGRVCSRRE